MTTFNTITRRNALITAALALALAFIFSFVAATTALAQNPSAMYVFGDSLSDVGNVYNNSTLNAVWDFGFGASGNYNGPALWPGPTPPNTGSSLMNAGLITSGVWGYTKGAFTDGSDTAPSTSTASNWAQQLAVDLNLPLTASSSGGTDYAYGGATTDNTTTNISTVTIGNGYTVTANATVNNIGKQVATFQTSLGLAQASSSALYVVWGGGNDMLNNTNTSLFGATEQTAILNLTNNIQSLYNSGARNFLWPDLPPMASIPRYLGTNAAISSALSNACATFKTDEDSAILALKAADPGMKIAELDVLSIFTNVLANPGATTFTNVTSPAQLKLVNPDQYLFWDNTHPTTAADTLMANGAMAALAAAQIPEPSTITLVLFASSLPLILRRRR
ncbi:MAG TPA: SGNH/GDSL hydrolase family protein [Verrucomicrobiae bacterium]|nr:SGNH/GDSL hydrolase family protein [Verrucomicrobiae bacterium]